jgi:hypothetical protein
MDERAAINESSSSSSVLSDGDDHSDATSGIGVAKSECSRRIGTGRSDDEDESGTSGSSSSSSSSSSSISSSSCSSSSGSDSSDSSADDDGTTSTPDSHTRGPEQRPPARHPQDPHDEDEYDAAQQVRLWTERVPIGLGLCPWAMKSSRLERLKYTTCHDTTPCDVALRILAEAKELLYGCCQTAAATASGSLTDTDVVPPSPPPPLTSTLVVCPHVPAWNDDFQVFDDFVKKFPQQNSILFQHLTLVSFHPQFLRWRGLAAGIKVGSVVQSHKGIAGGFSKKSSNVFPATVLETNNPVFGQRRIKVRFHYHDDDDLHDKKEQYVPVDWLVDTDSSGSSLLGPPLPDNAMHRAPYPTIHLIRNEDLVIPCRDVSRVKRKNAQRMMKMGWKGVLQKAAGLN